MYFCGNVGYASLPVYLPTILAAMGYSSIDANGLSAPPYFCAFLFALITTYIGDRTQQRGLVLAVTSLVGGVGYIILATVKTVGVRYFAVFLAAAGVFSTIPNIIAWSLSKILREQARILFMADIAQTTRDPTPAVELAWFCSTSSDSAAAFYRRASTQTARLLSMSRGNTSAPLSCSLRQSSRWRCARYSAGRTRTSTASKRLPTTLM